MPSGNLGSRVQIRGKHRSGGATPTGGGGKGDSSSSNLDLESDKSSVGSQDDKAHAALVIGK